MEFKKSCPWCNESDDLSVETEPFDSYHAYCMNCGSQGPRSDSESQAIEAWNLYKIAAS